MESMRYTVIDQGLPVDEWKIYREVTREAAHGRVVGQGAGIKGKDVYGSPSQGGNKHQCTDLKKSKRFRERSQEVEKNSKACAWKVKYTSIISERMGCLFHFINRLCEWYVVCFEFS